MQRVETIKEKETCFFFLQHNCVSSEKSLIFSQKIMHYEWEKNEKPQQDSQSSERGELLEGAWLDPPDLVMLQPSVEKKPHTAVNMKCARAQRKRMTLMHVCVQLCCGLNNSHLLQWRAVVKARQMLYLVVRQLPTTIHKAYINTGTSCGFIAWEIMGVTGLFGRTVSSVSKAIQQDNNFLRLWGGWLDFIVQILAVGHDSQQSLPLTSPACMCTHSTLRRGSCSQRSRGRAERPARVNVL